MEVSLSYFVVFLIYTTLWAIGIVRNERAVLVSGAAVWRLSVFGGMLRKRPASKRITAAELQRLHGDLLATAPYVDLSPFRLVKAVAEQGIIITEPVARMWGQ